MLKLTRQELYDLVWTEAVDKVAQRYFISGAGLQKICTDSEPGAVAVQPQVDSVVVRVRHGVEVTFDDVEPSTVKLPLTTGMLSEKQCLGAHL